MDIIILIISLLLLFRGKLAWVLLGILALTTSYLGAGTNLSTFPVTHNVSDSGLILYIALFLYILKKNKGKLKKSSISYYLIAFYIFLLLSIFVDIFINKTNIISVIKTPRHWLFLSCIFIFYYIPSNEVEKLIKYLFGITSIISIIMLIDFTTGIKIINIDNVKEISVSGVEYTRGLIPSTYTLFFIFLLISNYFNFSKGFKYLYISLLLAVIFASMIRSLLTAAIIGILMTILFKEKLKLKNIVISILSFIILISIITSIPLVKERISSGIEDLTTIDVKRGNNNGTFSYRILNLTERVNYIFNKTQYSLFGIGNIEEKNFKEVFVFGLTDESTGNVVQTNSPDIAWTNLILRLGFLGTLFYLVFYLSTFGIYMYRKTSPLSLTLFIYLFINFTMISFASWNIAQGQFMLFPMLLYFYITRNIEKRACMLAMPQKEVV
jgi:hypothetical protein